MAGFSEHPEIQDDLRAAPPPTPANWDADGRMDVFLEQIERLSKHPNYRKVWPDRIPGVAGEVSIAGAALGTLGAVTIYAWEREGYIVCLEVRIGFDRIPRFRWLACQHGASPASAMADARRRARMP